MEMRSTPPPPSNPNPATPQVRPAPAPPATCARGRPLLPARPQASLLWWCSRCLGRSCSAQSWPGTRHARLSSRRRHSSSSSLVAGAPARLPLLRPRPARPPLRCCPTGCCCTASGGPRTTSCCTTYAAGGVVVGGQSGCGSRGTPAPPTSFDLPGPFGPTLAAPHAHPLTPLTRLPRLPCPPCPPPSLLPLRPGTQQATEVLAALQEVRYRCHVLPSQQARGWRDTPLHLTAPAAGQVRTGWGGRGGAARAVLWAACGWGGGFGEGSGQLLLASWSR